MGNRTLVISIEEVGDHFYVACAQLSLQDGKATVTHTPKEAADYVAGFIEGALEKETDTGEAELRYWEKELDDYKGVILTDEGEKK